MDGRGSTVIIEVEKKPGLVERAIEK